MITRNILTCVALLAVSAAIMAPSHASAAETAKTRTIRVAVFDDKGQPVPDAKVVLLADYQAKTPETKPASGGVAEFTISADLKEGFLWGSTVNRAIVQAPGMAPAIATFAGKDEVETSVTLTPGVEVEFQISSLGKPLPTDATIQVVNAGLAPAAFQSLYASAHGVRPGGDRITVAQVTPDSPGKFRTRIAPDFGDIYLIIDHPEVIRWHFFGPLNLGDNKDKVIFPIALPKPASITATFDASDNPGAGESTTYTLQYTQKMPAHGLHGNDVEQRIVDGNNTSVRFENLSPNAHSVSVTAATGRVQTYESGVQAKGDEKLKLTPRPALPLLKVVAAETKKAIPGASTMWNPKQDSGSGYGTWITADENGLVQVLPSQVHHGSQHMASASVTYTVVVKAPGYGARVLSVRAPATEQEVTVELDKGKAVEFLLTAPGGAPLPAEIQPAVIVPDAIPQSWYWRRNTPFPGVSKDFLDVESLGGGRYRATVGDGIDELKVYADAPGVIRHFISRAVPRAEWEKGPVAIELPRAGGAHVTWETTVTDVSADSAAGYSVHVNMNPDGNGGPPNVHAASAKLLDGSADFEALPPGKYSINLYGQNSALADAKRLQASGSVTVAAGTTNTVAFVFTAQSQSGISGAISLPTVRVTDAADKPVSGAVVWARPAGDELNLKRADEKEGGLHSAEVFNHRASGSKGPTGYEYLVAAPNRVPTIVAFDMPTTTPELRAVVNEGRRVIITIKTSDNRPVPASLVPNVYDEASAVPAWVGIQPDRSTASGYSKWAVESLGSGRFAFHVDEETSGLHVLINEPDFIRGFNAGPFDEAQLASGEITVEVPSPWTLEASFGPGDRTADYEACWMELSRSVTLPPKRGWSFRIANQQSDTTSITAVFNDLAPADEKSYSVEAGTGSYERRHYGGDNRYSDRRTASFSTGTKAVVSIPYEPFDESMLKGSEIARVTVKSLDGKPAAGKPYSVTIYERRFGQKTLASGTIPDSGVVEITGLPRGAPDKPTSVSEVFGDKRLAMSYNFTVADNDLGSIEFFELDRDSNTVTPWPAGKPREFEFTLAPSVGDTAPDIELTEISSGNKVRLADFKGQVIYIDFWATWCGPCQDPMASLDRLAKARAQEWDGKVAIIGASIDDKLETVQKHIKLKGWTHPRQLWCAPEGDKAGWQAPAAKTYGIRGVPTALLINREGKVVWRGHPGGGNEHEAKIEELLR